jgi:hypothetical protein
MTPEIKAFKFPTWQEMVERNQPFLDAKEYKGYHLQVQVSDNLYLLIDCQNNSCVFPTSKDVIRFAWSTKNEFAVSSVMYENCEAGYIMGCTHLVNMAHEFKKCFEEFTGAHAFTMRRRIAVYNEEHPVEEPQTSAQDAPDEEVK